MEGQSVVSPLGNVSLRKVAQGWEFASEKSLEDFVWSALEDLLHLRPFQRQYAVKGEVCDILALTADRSLVILELKNTEDRYVVQQLTRYYANLLEERPFSDVIDYEKPVRLIAIAPSFHRHNHIDRQHSRLVFEFIQVKVTQTEQFYLELRFEDEGKPPVLAPLPYQEMGLARPPEALENVPGTLLKWLGTCSGAEQEAFLETRQQILTFDSRIQEIIEAKSIQYGTGKSKLCAEICFNRSLQRPILFLWLPLPTYWKAFNKPERIGRLRLWLNDGALTHVGHVPEGFGKMRPEEEWESIPRSKWPRKSLTYNSSHRSLTANPIRGYMRISLGVEDSSNPLELVVSVALQKWIDRL